MKHLCHKWNTWRVLSFFFERPFGRFYIREVARELKMSVSTVFRSLGALEKDELVTVKRERNASYYKAAQSPLFKSLKIAYTVSKISISKIIDLVRRKSSGVNCFLLFGSAARGEDDVNSDYDFVLVSSQSSLTSLDLSEKLGREVNLKKFTISEWKKQSEENKAFYLDVIKDSIALIGEKPVL